MKNIKIEAHGGSDIGRVRDSNQDAFLVDIESGLFIVADGMGGHAAGEVASAETVKAIKEGFGDPPPEGCAPEEIERRMVGLVKNANRRVLDMGESRPECNGMGTTVTAMVIHGRRAFLAQVGDSRAYLLRGGGIEQVTEDHSWVNEQVKLGFLRPEEAETHYLKNIVTRSVGHHQAVEVDTFVVELRPGDRLLLCSDGLSNMVTDDMILSLIDGSPPREATEKLIDRANSRGGMDNITAVVVMAGDGS